VALSDVLGEPFGVSRLRLTMGLLLLLGQLRGVHRHKAQRGHLGPSLAILHRDRTNHTAPIPPPRDIAATLGGCVQESRQRDVLLPPCFHLLTDRTRPGHSCD
jgi:hypothetical protein